jgi:hypothetical protein
VFWQVALSRGVQLVVLGSASEPEVAEQFEKLLLLPLYVSAVHRWPCRVALGSASEPEVRSHSHLLLLLSCRVLCCLQVALSCAELVVLGLARTYRCRLTCCISTAAAHLLLRLPLFAPLL